MELSTAAALAPPQTPALDVSSLFVEHGAFIGRVIARLVGDGAHVDDLLQETFIVAFKKRDSFDGRAAVRTWLYAIAANLSMRHRRGAFRFAFFQNRFASESVSTRPEEPDQKLEREQTVAAVRAVMSQLPFKQREAFSLYELEGLEGTEIAALLDIPIGTVWTRLHGARSRFQKLMRSRQVKEGNP